MKSAPGLGEGPHILAPKGGGQQFGGVQVKAEDTDGSYDCAICFESVRRSADALRCSQCSSNPFHGACLQQSGFSDTCPQCSRSTLVAGVRASGEDAARIDLTDGELDLSAAATELNTSTADAMDAIVQDSSEDTGLSTKRESVREASRVMAQQECSVDRNDRRKTHVELDDDEVQEEMINMPDIDAASALLREMGVSAGDSKSVCAHCGIAEGEGSHKQTARLSRCLGCQRVFYCSRLCQKKDWKVHKTACAVSAPKKDGERKFLIATKDYAKGDRIELPADFDIGSWLASNGGPGVRCWKCQEICAYPQKGLTVTCPGCKAGMSVDEPLIDALKHMADQQAATAVQEEVDQHLIKEDYARVLGMQERIVTSAASVRYRYPSIASALLRCLGDALFATADIKGKPNDGGEQRTSAEDKCESARLFNEAHRIYREDLEVCESMGDASLCDRLRGKAFANLGKSMCRLGKLQEACSAHEKRHRLALRSGDMIAAHEATAALAEVHHMLRRIDEGDISPRLRDVIAAGARELQCSSADQEIDEAEFCRLKTQGWDACLRKDAACAKKVFNALLRVGLEHDLAKWEAEGNRGLAASLVLEQVSTEDDSSELETSANCKPGDLRARCVLVEKWFAAAVRAKDRMGQAAALEQLAQCTCSKHSAKTQVKFALQMLELSLKTSPTPDAAGTLLEVNYDIQMPAYLNLFLAHEALQQPYHARAAALCLLQAAESCKSCSAIASCDQHQFVAPEDSTQARKSVWPHGVRTNRTPSEHAMYALWGLATTDLALQQFDSAACSQRRMLGLLRQIEPRAVAAEEETLSKIIAAKDASTSPDGGFTVGDRVLVHGLQAAKEKNGWSGTLDKFDAPSGRWQLVAMSDRLCAQLDTEVGLRVKAINLVKMDSSYGLTSASRPCDDRKAVGVKFKPLHDWERPPPHAMDADRELAEGVNRGQLVLYTIRTLTQNSNLELGLGTKHYLSNLDDFDGREREEQRRELLSKSLSGVPCMESLCQILETDLGVLEQNSEGPQVDGTKLAEVDALQKMLDEFFTPEKADLTQAGNKWSSTRRSLREYKRCFIFHDVGKQVIPWHEGDFVDRFQWQLLGERVQGLPAFESLPPALVISGTAAEVLGLTEPMTTRFGAGNAGCRSGSGKGKGPDNGKQSADAAARAEFKANVHYAELPKRGYETADAVLKGLGGGRRS